MVIIAILNQKVNAENQGVTEKS